MNLPFSLLSTIASPSSRTAIWVDLFGAIQRPIRWPIEGNRRLRITTAKATAEGAEEEGVEAPKVL
jgi:hypothetical protein